MTDLPVKVQEYLSSHALDPEFLLDYGVTWTEDTINIPVKDFEGKYLFTKTRYLIIDKEEGGSKYKNASGSKRTLFNGHNIVKSDTVIICEGEIDTLCLVQRGIAAVSSTGGAGTFDIEWLHQLKGKNIYICYDNDDAGKKGTLHVLDLLPTAKVISIPDVKDICDFFAESKSVEDYKVLITQAQDKNQWSKQFCNPDFNVLSNLDIKALKFQEEPWLIKNILYSQGFCFIYGSEGTGKSLLALDMAKSLIDGKNWLSHDRFQVTRKHKVLVLDKENPQPMIQKRLSGLGLLDISDKRIFYLEYPEKFTLSDGKGGVSEFAKTISDTVRNEDIDLIIIDSFVDFMVGNESSSGDTQEFFNALKGLYPRIAYLGLHHENKPSQGVFRSDSQRMRGSSNISAQLVTSFRIEPAGHSKSELTFKQVKARDSLKLGKIMLRMNIAQTDGETVVTGFDYVGDIDDAIDEKQRNQVKQLIEELTAIQTHTTRQQLIKECEAKNISTTTLDRTLRTMKNEGIISEFKKGREKIYMRESLFNLDQSIDDLGNPLE